MLFLKHFDLDPDIAHLNHAAVAPWPRRTVEAIQRFAIENLHQGSRDYAGWLRVESALREQLRQLVGAASTEEIALLKSTSEALSVVAHGLDWQTGDGVVITDQEFPSNRIVWESLAGRGVTVHAAPLAAGPTPEDAILACMDARTRLLAVSSVQYGTGLRLDLERLGAHCRERGVLFCVDAIQSLGALPLDVERIGADFVMADGHKWMLGPEGLAVFYCRAAVRERLQLHQYGWHMVEHAGDFDRTEWEPAHSGRRFECGSPNMLGIHALHASLSLILEIGLDTISREVLNNTSYIIDFISRIDERYELITPRDRNRHGGIVTFRPRDGDSATLYERLRDGGVICAQRGGGVRFSPHFYTPRAVLDRALGLLAS